MRVSTPWGVLREPTRLERGRGPGPHATVVLDQEIELRFIRLAYELEPSLPDVSDLEVGHATQRVQILLPLAGVLGVPRPDYVVAQPMWTRVGIPGESGSGFAGTYRIGPFARSAGDLLSDDESSLLSEWTYRVDQRARG
jgi:hypothetical protein